MGRAVNRGLERKDISFLTILVFPWLALLGCSQIFLTFLVSRGKSVTWF